jgi:ATP synthase protein I
MEDTNKHNKNKKTADKLKKWQTSQTQAYRTYIKTSAVGLEFGLAIVVGMLIGYFIDRYFSTSPYGLIIGLIIGSVAAAKRLWTFVKSYLEKNGKNDDG